MKPVILLAFANELVKGRFLKNLSNEQNEIRKALEKAEDNALCELVILSNATLESLTETFQRKKYRDRIAVFHYAGHAASYKLLLEGKEGETAEAHSSGLVPFLASQNGLKLVFLNGCNSERQAQDLIDAGVPITVGTVEAVNDSIATDLASSFYNAIGEGAGIKQAWDQATYIQQSQKGNQDLSQYYSTRSIELLDEEPDRFPWQIYTRPGSEDILNWNLPEAADNPYFGLPDLSDRFDLPDDPYRFLERYQRKDARVFFGRGTYIRDMHQRLSSPFSAPCLLFYGQSGVGKSSLLEAGLFPRLEVEYKIQCIRRDPDTGLLAHLKKTLGAESNLLDAWKKQEQGSNKKGFILILDQVEEVFTRPRKEEKEELDAFLKEAAQIFSNPQDRPKGKLVLAYRKEYDSEIEKACRKVSLAKEKVFLDRLDRNGIMEVVKGLTSSTALQNKYKVKIDEDLPVVIADDLLVDRDSPISPVLQIIMTRLWQEDVDKAHRNFIVADYNELRKNGILLDDFFHQQMKELQAWEKQHQTNVVSSGLALDILKYHTTQLTTAASRNLEELKALYSNRKDILEPLLQKMSELYLLANIDNQKSILAHDTLAPIVRRELNDSDKPGQRALRILQSKGVDYKLDPKGTYIDIADLKIVEDGADGTHAWTESELALVEKSRKRRARLAASRKRTNIIQAAGVVGIALLGVIATIFGVRANKQAKVNGKIAEASRVVRTDATKALTIISEALEIDPEDKNALQTRHDIFSENEFYYQTLIPDSTTLQKNYYGVESIAISSDANLVAAAIADRVILWNKEGKQENILQHNGKVSKVEFLPDGKKIFTVSEDYTARFWNLNGSPDRSLNEPGDSIIKGDLSFDNNFILTGTNNGKVQLWNPTGEQLYQWQAHQDSVIMMGGIGNKVITGSWDKGLKLWNWDGNEIKELQLLSNDIRPVCVDYHDSVNAFLVGYRDGMVRLWNLDGTLRKEYKVHSARVNDLSFTPDGKQFLTASSDYQIKLWSLSGNLLKTYKGHDNLVKSIAFDGRENTFASGGKDGIVKLWKLESKVDRSIEVDWYSIESLDISSDGKEVILGTGLRDISEEKDTTFPILIWDLDGQLKSIGSHQLEVYDVQISNDGAQYLSGSIDGSARVWSSDGTALFKLEENIGKAVLEVEFLEENKGIVTAEETIYQEDVSVVYFWDTNGQLQDSFFLQLYINDLDIFTDASEPNMLFALTNDVRDSAMIYSDGMMSFLPLDSGRKIRSVKYSPDGQYFAIGEAGKNATLHVFETSNKQSVKLDAPLNFEMDNETGGRAITSIAFSSDNRYVAAGAEGGLVKVFDIQMNGQEVITLNDFNGNDVTSVLFSKDDQWIVVGSRDGKVRSYKNEFILLNK